MQGLKDHVGTESSPQTVTVTAEALTAFARAIGGGEDGRSVDSTERLPTFFTCFRDGEFEIMNRIGISLKEILHGEQGYEIHGAIRAGETVKFRSKLSQVMEKKGKDSLLAFMIFETPFFRESGEPIATSHTTVIYRTKLPEGSA